MDKVELRLNKNNLNDQIKREYYKQVSDMIEKDQLKMEYWGRAYTLSQANLKAISGSYGDYTITLHKEYKPNDWLNYCSNENVTSTRRYHLFKQDKEFRLVFNGGCQDFTTDNFSDLVACMIDNFLSF